MTISFQGKKIRSALAVILLLWISFFQASIEAEAGTRSTTMVKAAPEQTAPSPVGQTIAQLGDVSYLGFQSSVCESGTSVGGWQETAADACRQNFAKSYKTLEGKGPVGDRCYACPGR